MAVGAALAGVGLSTRAPAQPGNSTPEVVGQRMTMHSAVLGEDRTISVHVPASYDSNPHAYPVLYVLDGEQLFVPMVGVAQALEWAFRAPPLIGVGIHNRNRDRDLATRWTSAAPKGISESTGADAGGADRFLAHAVSLAQNTDDPRLLTIRARRDSLTQVRNHQRR